MTIEFYYISGAAGAAIVLLITGYLLYQLSNSKARLQLALSENTKLIWSVESLDAEKIYSIKRIQELTDQAEYLTKSNEELLLRLKETHDSLEKLRAEKFNNIQLIQEMTVKIEYLTKTNADQLKLHTDAHNSAKASLVDLGNNLSKQLIELHKQESQEVRQLSEKNIAVSSEKFNSEFQKILSMVIELNSEVNKSKSSVDNIRTNLLSPSGAGGLAEMTLENLLKNSNLRMHTDFIVQHNTPLEEGRQRPDAVIFLPGKNLMVIDAKASKFLLEMGVAKDNADKKVLEQDFMKTMNKHLKNLVSKEYADNTATYYHVKSQQFGKVFTLMFLPSESAVERISEIDPEFTNRAATQNIFAVGPAGLRNMLSFAKYQINDNERSINHNLIIEEVKKLLKSVATLAEFSQKLGSNIQGLANNYDKFSRSFNKNFLPKARRVQSLGIDIGKEIIKPLGSYQMIPSDSELIEVESSEIAMIDEIAAQDEEKEEA